MFALVLPFIKIQLPTKFWFCFCAYWGRVPAVQTTFGDEGSIMADCEYGRVLVGDEALLLPNYERFQLQPVDQEMLEPPVGGLEPQQTTLGHAVSVTGPGTFFGNAQRTLEFEPTTRSGWYFDRKDLPESLPIAVGVQNVWTVVRNIVLCSGSPHNYMRMVEHIVALKYLGLDNVLIRMDSGDPPLFDRSSMDLVEAIDKGGIVTQSQRATYVTVKEPVTVVDGNGGFLTFEPAAPGEHRLKVDCAVDFSTAIGQQRIRFDVNPKTVRHGAFARTNTNLWMMLYCKTVGKVFADTRNLGYTLKNILVAGPRRYANKPNLIHKGKSLEAVWHRSVLDLLAAIALIDRGRLVGSIKSYKAGHALDVEMVRALYRDDLLEEV
jgi:UDP-3-O-acyl-N-acetylglucosamine deacetylase